MAIENRIPFSKTALNALALPEPGKRLTFYDDETKKLAIRVTASGTKTFYVVKRAGTSMAWVKLGTFPEMTVEQARKAAALALGEFASGTNPAEAKRAIKGEPTFREVFDEYLKHKRKKNGTPLGERTKTEYQNGLRLYLGSIASLKLSAISHQQVAKINRKVGSSAPIAANRAMAIVRAVFNYARDRRIYSGENPAQGVSGFAETARERFALADELPYLFQAIAASPQRDYFLLSLLTGARRSNVCAMAWRDLDLDGGIWRIAKTKNGTSQHVTLSPEAAAVLVARKDAASGSPFVFPGTGKTGHLVEPKKAWATIINRAGLLRLLDLLRRDERINEEQRTRYTSMLDTAPATAERELLKLAASAGIDREDFAIDDLHIHDLRRTLGSWQAMTGASLAIIGKSLNHKTQQATAIYARLDLDPVRQSVNTATSAMLEAAGLKDAADVVKLPAKRGAA